MVDTDYELVRYILYIVRSWVSTEVSSNHGLTGEIAETAEEPRGIEIQLRRGCLAGDACAETRNPKH
jgi:hypothetical protein